MAGEKVKITPGMCSHTASGVFCIRQWYAED